MRRVRWIGSFLCTSLLYAAVAFAQVTAATLRGRVLDPQGSPAVVLDVHTENIGDVEQIEHFDHRFDPKR